MRHATGQQNPERLRYWYCPDCGKRHEVTHEVQELQSRLAETGDLARELHEALTTVVPKEERDLWVPIARDSLARYERAVATRANSLELGEG